MSCLSPGYAARPGSDVYIPSGTTDLRERKLDTPDFALVPQTIFADNLQFGVATKVVRISDVSREGSSCCSVAMSYVQTSGLECCNSVLVVWVI